MAGGEGVASNGTWREKQEWQYCWNDSWVVTGVVVIVAWEEEGDRIVIISLAVMVPVI